MYITPTSACSTVVVHTAYALPHTRTHTEGSRWCALRALGTGAPVSLCITSASVHTPSSACYHSLVHVATMITLMMNASMLIPPCDPVSDSGGYRVHAVPQRCMHSLSCTSTPTGTWAEPIPRAAHLTHDIATVRVYIASARVHIGYCTYPLPHTHAHARARGNPVCLHESIHSMRSWARIGRWMRVID